MAVAKSKRFYKIKVIYDYGEQDGRRNYMVVLGRRGFN